MTEQSTAQATKRKRERSPNYPGIDIGEALSRARQLYDQERRYAAPLKTILAHWGYKESSGPGFTTLAALKRFGLLIDEGTGQNRKARLSDDALAILLDQREDSQERQRLIKEAALTPPIHKELWGKYGTTLPSDATLRFELQHDKGFSEGGATEFIRQYRKTLQYAGLTEHDKLSGEDEDKPPVEEGMTVTPPADIQGQTPLKQSHTVSLAIAPGKWATLQAPYPLTERQWKQLTTSLEAQRVGFVLENGEQAEQGQPD